MGKLTTYTIIMAGFVALFYFTGLTIDCLDANGNACVGDEDCMCKGGTASSTILNMMLKPEGWKETDLFSKAALLLGGIGALAVGIIAARALQDARLALVAPMAVFMFALLWDFLKVISKIWSVHPLLSVLVSLIFSPLFIYYAIAVVEWWGTGS